MIGMLASDDAGATVLGLMIIGGFMAFFGAIGHSIGKPKGRGQDGALLGCFLGVLGIIIIACMGPKETVAQPSAFTGQQPNTHPASWLADPMGRNQLRWWDGRNWTDQVANDGMTRLDPIIPAAPVVVSYEPPKVNS